LARDESLFARISEDSATRTRRLVPVREVAMLRMAITTTLSATVFAACSQQSSEHSTAQVTTVEKRQDSTTSPLHVSLTIAPPTGGTIVAEGINCGSLGRECTVSRPRGSRVALVAWADKGFMFQNFTGDCSQNGETQMLESRACGGIFVKGRPLIEEHRPPSPPSAPSPQMAEVVHKEIEELLERYRRAWESRDFEALQRVWPGAPAALRTQFGAIRGLKLTFMTTPKYVQLDWFAGRAVVEIATQQTTEGPTGRRPPIDWVEVIDVQKRGTDNEWFIVSITRTPK
jgi:hypothetical protein